MARPPRGSYSAPTMKKKPISPIPVSNDTRTTPLHEEIATQAYILWEHYGHPQGRDLSIWLEAERQVLGTDASVNLQAGGAVKAKDLSIAVSLRPSPPSAPAEEEQHATLPR